MEPQIINSALLVMDMQDGIVAMLPNPSAILNNTARAIAKARSLNIPVIFVVVGFRQGAPEISINNKNFNSFKSRLAGVDMDSFMNVHDQLKPSGAEVVVTKRRVSAFAGSDLEIVLRAYQVNHLILSGISTSGVVLSTLREAADKDFKITVLADCCADHSTEVHEMLVGKIFPQQAEVTTADEWNRE